MISLSDEVQKFSKLLYNPQLKEFVTIDQKFAGGGISMQSIIEENNFIVEQLKRMHAYFANYCKLNEKVYQKIIEHELSALNDKNKFHEITSSVDRNINNNLQIMKELSEKTIMENKKSLSLISTELLPLKKSLALKLDLDQCESKIKTTIKDYDQGVLFPKQNIEAISQVSQGQILDIESQSLTPVVKKTGKVSYQDFYEMTLKLQKKFEQIQQKQNLLTIQSQENKSSMLRFIPMINSHDNDLIRTTQQLYSLNARLQKQRVSSLQGLDQLNKLINQKINEDVWKEKFNEFYLKKVNVLEMQMIRNRDQVNKQLAKLSRQTEAKLKKLGSDFQGCSNKLLNLDKTLMVCNNQIDHIKTSIKFHFDELEAEDKKLKGYLDEINNETSSKIASLSKMISSQITEIKTSIASLSSTIEATVFKAIDKKMTYRIKAIQGHLAVYKQSLNGFTKQFQALKQDLKVTKQMLCKKANFSDILMNFDRKVDREDIKTLELMIQDTSQKISTLSYNESTSLNKIQRPESAKKPVSRAKHRKTLMGQRVSRIDMLDRETSIFMCGLEAPVTYEKRSYGQKIEQRILLSPHNRRKSMRQTVTVVNDYTL